MYLHALRYTVSNVNFKWKQIWNNSSTRVILGHSKPPSLPGQNQAGLDETETCIGDSKFMNCPTLLCHLVLGLNPFVEMIFENLHIEASNMYYIVHRVQIY